MKMPTVTEISRDYDNFLVDLTNHINDKGIEIYQEYWQIKTKRWISKQPIYISLLSKARPGDVLEYWQSDEGFAKKPKGYYLMRNHFEIAKITVSL